MESFASIVVGQGYHVYIVFNVYMRELFISKVYCRQPLLVPSTVNM